MRAKVLLLMLVIGPVPAMARSAVVACVGDSITYGSGTSDPTRESYPAQLQGMLQKADPAWKVLNFGVGGTTLLHNGDLPYIKQGAYQGALTSNAEVVIIMLGTNDSKPQNWAYKSQYMKDYYALIDSFKALPSRPQVWICRPVPAFYENFTIRPAVIRDEILPLVDQIGRQENVLVIDLYTALLDYGSLFADGIHPNASGARIMAQTILPYLTSMRFVRDLNHDGVVNGLDFAALAARWLESDSALDIAPPAGDGVITVLDIMELCTYWMAYPGLVTHWQLDETAGDVAADRLGHFDGTLQGSPVWQPYADASGGALELDGIDDFVSAGTVLKPSDGPLTVFVWVKGGGPGQVILSQSNEAGQGVLWLGTDATTGALRTELTDNGRFTRPLISSASVTDGAWHGLRLVWDGSHRHLYVDDQEVAVDTRTLGPLASSKLGFCLGAGGGFKPGTFWSGLVDDVRFYNRDLVP